MDPLDQFSVRILIAQFPHSIRPVRRSSPFFLYFSALVGSQVVSSACSSQIISTRVMAHRSGLSAARPSEVEPSKRQLIRIYAREMALPTQHIKTWIYIPKMLQQLVSALKAKLQIKGKPHAGFNYLQSSSNAVSSGA